jgi:serine/threonine protein phosphatase PrpC
VRKRNQDAHIVIPQYNGVSDNYMFGVFDGHGQFGTEASQFASSSFALSFSLAGMGDPGGSPVKKTPAGATASPATTPNKAQRRGTLMMMNDMKHTMKETHKALLQERTFDVSLSGTTAVVAFIDANRLFVANAGDSKAVLATQSNGRLMAKDLNVEHKANTNSEGKRIAASGGKVKEDQSYEGAPARVFLQEPLFYKGQYFEIPGLAMSRSLGDKVAHSVGVSSEAEVLKKILDRDDRFIVVASDGLWEFVTSAEAINIVAQSLDSPSGWGDLDVAAAKLLAEAEVRWALEDEVCDDITIIVIGIDFQEAEEAQTEGK